MDTFGFRNRIVENYLLTPITNFHLYYELNLLTPDAGE